MESRWASRSLVCMSPERKSGVWRIFFCKEILVTTPSMRKSERAFSILSMASLRVGAHTMSLAIMES